MSDESLITLTTDFHRRPTAIVGGVDFSGRTQLEAAQKAVAWIIKEMADMRTIHPDWFEGVATTLKGGDAT